MKTILSSIAILLFVISCDSDNNYYYTEKIGGSSLFFSVGQGNWNYDANDNYWYYTYNTNLIDDIVINQGFVLVYMGDTRSNNNIWKMLPRTEVYTDANGQFTQAVEFGFWMGPGFVELEIFNSNPPAQYPDFNADFKLVVVDESDYEIMVKKKVDLDNYNSLKDYLEKNKIDFKENTTSL